MPETVDDGSHLPLSAGRIVAAFFVGHVAAVAMLAVTFAVILATDNPGYGDPVLVPLSAAMVSFGYILPYALPVSLVLAPLVLAAIHLSGRRLWPVVLLAGCAAPLLAWPLAQWLYGPFQVTAMMLAPVIAAGMVFPLPLWRIMSGRRIPVLAVAGAFLLTPLALFAV